MSVSRLQALDQVILHSLWNPLSEKDNFELPPIRAELLIKKGKVLYAVASY